MIHLTKYKLLRNPDDPRDLLLTPHVDQPADPKKIRLFDCERRRYDDFFKREVEQVKDLITLRKRVTEMVRSRRPAPTPSPRPAPTRRKSTPPRAVDPFSPRPLDESQRARFRDSLAERRDLAFMEFRETGGLIHTVLFDPGAQEPSTGQTVYLVTDGLPRRPQVVPVPGAVDFGRLPGQRTLHGRGQLEDIVTAYRSWQTGLRAAHARDQAITALARLAHEHPRAPFTLEAPFDAVRPDTDDLRLAILWSASPNRHVLRDWFHRCGETLAGAHARCGLLGPEVVREDLERTLSARVAEKAARWAYARNGTQPPRNVRDVAVEQLANDGTLADAEYSRCDLAVVRDDGTTWVDVKNARSSSWISEYDHTPQFDRFSRGDSRVPRGTYIEHCVPQFKKARDQKTSVTIAGVFSPRASLPRLLRAEYRDETVTFLGESSKALCDDLKAEFQREGELTLTFGSARVRNARRDAVFLPPWMFVLPGEWYSQWDERCSAAVQAARLLGPGWVPTPDMWALCIAAGADDELPAWANATALPWRSFVQRLRELRGRGRLALPYIYLATLSHFLEVLRSLGAGGHLPGSGEMFAPAGYRDFLFSGGPTNRPLGLYDPLRTVDRLIGSLMLIMRGDLQRIGSFQQFHFSHSGSLKVPSAACDTGWATLLFPYCGGCGREHLVLGAQGTELCAKCGHLVCPTPDCRFCHNTRACQSAAEERKLAGTRRAGL